MPDSTESAVPTANRAVGIVMHTCHNLPSWKEQFPQEVLRCPSTWRRAQGLTAEQVADRAGISRPTLRTIETHPERASFGNVMAVLAVLGVDEAITTAIDPLESERGRALVLARLEPGARP